MKSGIFLLLIVFFVCLTFTGNTQNSNSPKNIYDIYWEKIDSLEMAGLPRTALSDVEQVYNLAKLESNTGQLLKSLIFKLKFSYAFEADNYAKQIIVLEEDLRKLHFPDSAVAHSMLGEMYWNYFTQNRYRFYNRSNMLDYNSKDLQTWSLDQILEKSREHYLISIQDKDLLYEINADSLLHNIIQKGYPENFRFKTVYDFLAFRAINFLRTDEVHLKNFTTSFKMDEERLFSSASSFCEMDLHESNSPSNTILVLRIFQDMLKKHQEENNYREFLLTNLHRLNFVFQKSTHTEKSEIYIKALENMVSECQNYQDVWGEVKFHLAKAIYARGNTYIKNITEKYRWDFKSAKDICTEILESRNQIDEFTVENCRALIASITQKQVALLQKMC